MPRLCAGVLFDHLWEEKLISAKLFPSAPRLLLARSSRQDDLLSSAPDFIAGAGLILNHLLQCGCKRVYLGVPFSGDQAVDAAGDALRLAAADGPFQKIDTLDCSTPAKRKAAINRLARLKGRAGIVCTEDNVTAFLWQELIDTGHRVRENISLVSMQGTGAIDLPIPRLRYDYRQLGRDTVTAALQRCRSNLLVAPTFIAANPL